MRQDLQDNSKINRR
uniref:Uncharacterized protein n=1 Tax=Rhizophora mucronata TaxID=61149 RepID=A0A2P2PXQ7_RHIMU